MKKKILFINGHLNVGGVEKSLIDILRNFDYDNYQVDLLLLEEYGDYLDEIPDSVNIRLCSLKNTYGSFVNCLKGNIKRKDWVSLKLRLIFLLMKLFGQKNIKLAKKILTENKKYDCVIGFRSGICSQIACFAVNANKKFIWWHHGEINVDKKDYTELINHVNKVISVSNSCAEMLCHEFNNINDKIVIIPNMIDFQTIKFKSNLYDPYKDYRNITKIITVGRLSREKNIKNVIYIADRLIKRKCNKFVWFIVGEGREEENIKNLIHHFQLEKYVKMLGSKANPYPYIQNADILVHTSNVESQCLTVLEGMALSIPCIVTESIGPKEFIKSYVNGILVSSNPDDIAVEILNVINNQQLYNKLKNNSKCIVEQQFDSMIIMNNLYKLLNEDK